jgi:hypothetical protein
MSNAKNDLINLSDFAWQRLWDRVQGLTDEEYQWLPVPGGWTAGDGAPLVDEAPPFTNLAWRISHIIHCLTEERMGPWLGVPSIPANVEREPATAAAALENLDKAYANFRAHLVSAEEDRLWEKLGPMAGPYADDDRGAWAIHILDEFIHHGAEVAVLRDLYRALHPADSVLEAALCGDRSAAEQLLSREPDLVRRAAETGRWASIPVLVDVGFAVDGPGPRTALHHAAGAGRVEVVQQLIELGADAEREDDYWKANALGWAEYFRKPEVIAYLRKRQP